MCAVRTKTPFDIALSVIRRVVSWIEKTPHLRVHILIISASVLLNGLVFVGFLIIAISNNQFWLGPSFGLRVVLNVIRNNAYDFAFMSVLVAVLGAIVDSLSFEITHFLVKKAINAPSKAVLFFLIDLFAAGALVTLALPILGFANSAFYDVIKEVVWDDIFANRSIISLLRDNPILLIVVVAVGVSSTIPSLGYLGLVLLALGLRSVPRRVVRIIENMLGMIHRKKDVPVAKQLAKIAFYLAFVGGSMVVVLTTLQ